MRTIGDTTSSSHSEQQRSRSWLDQVGNVIYLSFYRVVYCCPSWRMFLPEAASLLTQAHDNRSLRRCCLSLLGVVFPPTVTHISLNVVAVVFG